MKKIIALLLTLALMVGMVSTAAAGWENSGGRWWYSTNDGGYAADEWLNDGVWYYFDADGWMATGWRQIGGDWFFFENSGAMANGWKQINGAWYYFEDGAMVSGWMQQGGVWYYFDDGAMADGWKEIDGVWYFFADGAMADGWKQFGGAWYFFDDGAMADGWKQIGGDWFYFDDGAMADGWSQISGDWYYFDDGAMVSGWMQWGETWYYFNDGAMVTGDFTVDGETHTFDADGAWQGIAQKKGWVITDAGYTYYLSDGTLATGWTEILGSWYYFNEDGLMQTGWLELGEKKYFLAANGVMVTGELAIDGEMHTFDENGVWQSSRELSDIDLEGKTVYIYDFWTGTNWDEVKYDELTEEGKAIYDYRKSLEEKYNCKIVTKSRGSWGESVKEIQEFIEKDEAKDCYALFIVDAGDVGQAITSGLAAPWAYDLSGDKWNKSDLDFATVGGKVYGVASGGVEPRGMLFFNKRVLEEAGIDWDDIYDMQKEGKWTWEAFEELLKKVQRDTDNDGVNDIYGLIGNSDTLYMTATFAAGGTFFDYDKDDKLQPTMGSTAATSAMDWATIIKDTYWAQKPEDASWDWYKEVWKAGTTAFYIGESYEGFNGNSKVNEVDDEWGAVAFPTPTESTKFVTGANDNITLIPAAYDAETVAALAEIYDKFTDPAPGYESEDSWIGNKYELTDKRAVEETYAMLRQDEHAVANKTSLLGNVNTVLGQSLLWLLGGEETAAEIIEQSMSVWQEMCDAFNEKIKKLI